MEGKRVLGSHQACRRPGWRADDAGARGLGGGPARLKTTADSAGTAGVEAESWEAPWGVRRPGLGPTPGWAVVARRDEADRCRCDEADRCYQSGLSMRVTFF
jgi:hypothetical protein